MPRAKIEWEVVPIEDERLDKVAPKSDQKTTSFLSALSLRGKILLDQNAGKAPKPRLILEQPHGYYKVELGGTDKREDFSPSPAVGMINVGPTAAFNAANA